DVDLSQKTAVIAGWGDALHQMRKGEKVTIYVPSPLAYGKRGRMPKIGKNQILIFDMEIVDAYGPTQKMAKEMEMEKKYMEEEKRINDSLTKAQKK
ncbi:MAG TPA: FKBP-type peptidyl-prolyl cis-trans isomerase, partial [Ferruginibacter sp.]|nr:FKBP-type peptidyl-prolyl cis-trans isomerase [Ferruginibacter sp.]